MSASQEYKGKVALVTGAARGIGLGRQCAGRRNRSSKAARLGSGGRLYKCRSFARRWCRFHDRLGDATRGICRCVD